VAGKLANEWRIPIEGLSNQDSRIGTEIHQVRNHVSHPRGIAEMMKQPRLPREKRAALCGIPFDKDSPSVRKREDGREASSAPGAARNNR
jgi:hypothetical protein